MTNGPLSEQGARDESRTPTRILGLVEILKLLVLAFLVALLVAECAGGEFGDLAQRGALGWVILLIKILLILLVLLLIWRQRDLKCEITEPTGCTEEEPDQTLGITFVRVVGTASGAAFGSYELEVRKAGFTTPIAGVVSYPGGGGSGGSPVVNGELGRIDTTGLDDDAYEITLKVHPAWSGSPKVCTSVFTLLKATVYMNRIAGVTTDPHPFDPAAELTSGSQVVAVGGTVGIRGAAYVYECPGRKIKKYEIRFATVAAPGPEPGQPATGDPIPAAWPSAAKVVELDYVSPDHYKPWTRVGPAPMQLINTWKTFTVGSSTYFALKAGTWNSAAAGSGRFSLLETAEDTTGVTYHDIQHVWIDNHPILSEIVKFQWKNPATGTWEDIPKCEDLSMKKFGTVRIMGLAWDPLIDDAWWTGGPSPTAPNDNFGHYNLHYWKQFGAVQGLTGNLPDRVPALPAAPPVPVPGPADAGELALWDLTTLDAGPPPTPYTPPADPQLYRGESCTYTIRLYVEDTTVVPGPGRHFKYDYESVKIINDL